MIKLKELLSKKELEPEDLENSQPNHIAKSEKVCSRESNKMDQQLHKEVMCDPWI